MAWYKGHVYAIQCWKLDNLPGFAGPKHTRFGQWFFENSSMVSPATPIQPIARTAPINAATRYCAVFGYPVRHSASPAMQNAGMAALGLNWRYLAFEVHPDSLKTCLEGAMVMGFVGLNLTVPHKLLALDMVDLLDESARHWGAVNTVLFEGHSGDGAWRPVSELSSCPVETRSHGHNTDAEAITRSIREDLSIDIRGRRVLLLGAGGAGRTAALKLASEGPAAIHLINRTRGKAEAVAREIRLRYPEAVVSLEFPTGTVDLLVNATSLGLKPDDALPLDEKYYSLSKAGAVYDMIYRPAETPLLRAAKAAGCRVSNGLGMLLYQGARALEIWTGRPAPVAYMKEALERNVYGS
jgi:shikimate dehydrogenase